MKRFTLLSSFIILYYSTLTSAQDLTPWSHWGCFNNTLGLRNRIVQNCTDVETTDNVTNMTTTFRSCTNVTEIDTRTDVISTNILSNWAPMLPCSMTGMVSQTRTSSCQTAVFECFTNCTGGRERQRTISVPLCCAQQNYSEWSQWTPPGCSPSDPVQQTRQRIVLPCTPNIQCEPNCPDINQTRIVAQTAWGPWGLWSSTQVPMCGIGLRTRQRLCTNTSLVDCGIGCILGSIETDDQCCVVRNIWSSWSTWGQITNSGPCPDIRTRARRCVADPDVVGVNASQPVCDGTCTLNVEQSETQQVDTSRCDHDNSTMITTPVIMCPSSTLTRNDANNDDNNSNNAIIVVFATLFVIAVAINILLIAVIVFMVKRLRRDSYSPTIPGQDLYEPVDNDDKTKPLTHSPTDYETPVMVTADCLTQQNAHCIQMQDNPSYSTTKHDGLHM